ncbi:DUF907 domain-containing protein [Striga asiatica]|uniref:DUF907 domain-containing protein n=1 Tax=Striga asiatica TaxID=4170 RepID=A0A5A7RAE5_STRAF|nr:DUF907 domain-containing protein [Striga asiatica]
MGHWQSNCIAVVPNKQSPPTHKRILHTLNTRIRRIISLNIKINSHIWKALFVDRACGIVVRGARSSAHTESPIGDPSQQPPDAPRSHTSGLWDATACFPPENQFSGSQRDSGTEGPQGPKTSYKRENPETADMKLRATQRCAKPTDHNRIMKLEQITRNFNIQN